MTRQQIQVPYPAPSKVVISMFSDPDFHRRRLAATNPVGSYRVLDVSTPADPSLIRIERTIPIKIPGVTLGQVSVTYDERWDTTNRTGAISFSILGIPLRGSCRATAADNAGGCLVSFNWTIKSSVPVIGRQIERKVALQMETQSFQEATASFPFIESYQA